jgi:intermembrane space import and assembly protein 40
MSKETEDELWGRDPSKPRSPDRSPSPRPTRKKQPTLEDQLWGRDPNAPTPSRAKRRSMSTDDEASIDLKEDSDNPEDWDPKTAGPVFPNGEVNWDCPCLGNAAHGPCGTEFRGAFSCFIESKEDPKGADCLIQFREMQVCFTKYPELYAREDDEDEEDEDLGDVEILPPKKASEKEKTKAAAGISDDDDELDELVEELFGEDDDEEREKQKTQQSPESPRPRKGRWFKKENKEPVVGSPAAL